MLDRTIPFYNLILRCDRYTPTEAALPENFQLRKFQTGDERAWGALEHTIGDFPSCDLAERYFAATYCKDRAEAEKRCFFAVNADRKIVGTCTAWRDNRGGETVSSLHWLAVDPAYQGQGLGKALCQKTMEFFQNAGEFPVYIHTQPWSCKAVFLYLRQGFILQKTDTFSEYRNQYDQAMAALEKVLTERQYEDLLRHSAP